MEYEKEYEDKYYTRFEKKAEEIIVNNEKTSKLIDDAIAKVERISQGPVEEVWAHLLIFVDLLKDWLKGNYKNVPFGSLIMITASIIYFLSPFDIIPDFIIGLGYIDDLSIISYTFRQIQCDIDKYQVWRSVRDINSAIQ